MSLLVIDANPKTGEGAKKAPLHLVPPSATQYLAEAFKDGAAKYGPYNWRETQVPASTYYAAAKRHMDAWWDGEELSDDAKVHHLAHAMACMAIMLDALSINKLIDDRPAKGAAAKMQRAYVEKQTTPEAKQKPNLQELQKEFNKATGNYYPRVWSAYYQKYFL